MKILKLTLFTNQLESEKVFYNEVLGFSFLENHSTYFTVRIGWSELTFKKSAQEYVYHYCFLIPSNRLDKAIVWLEQRLNIIKISSSQKVQRFEDMKANSVYFFDASGNIAELIAIDDFYAAMSGNLIQSFSAKEILGINEIGIPTLDIENTNSELEEKFSTKLWSGNTYRFGTNGNKEGRFLLPNYNIKKTWFPTSIAIRPAPFEIVLENDDKQYAFVFDNKQIRLL